MSRIRVKIFNRGSKKIGEISRIEESGGLALIKTEDAGCFKTLSRKLRSGGFIPASVALNKRGITEFESP